MSGSGSDSRVAGLEWVEGLLSRLTPGRVLGGLALVLYGIAWNRGIALLYAMAALMIATLLVARLAPYLSLRGVNARRILPPHGREDEDLELEYLVEQRGRGTRWLLEVRDRLPCAPEARVTGLIERLRGSTRLRLRIPCELRGEHRIGPLRLESGFPLGVAKAGRDLADSEATLLVYPAPLPVRHLPLGADRGTPIEGRLAAPDSGGQDEFLAVREYRHGDSPRRIHWPASARRRQLMVREYQALTSPLLALLLDLRSGTDIGSGRHSTLEYAIKIGTSLGVHALHRGWRVSLLGAGRRHLELLGLQGDRAEATLLEALARARADGDTPYEAVVQRLLARHGRGGTVVLFEVEPEVRGGAADSNPASGLAAALGTLRARGFSPLVYRFPSAGFRHHRGPGIPHRLTDFQGVPVYRVHWGSDLRELFR